MPRKAFVEDLQQAIDNFSHARTAKIQPGPEDGSLTFKYGPPAHDGPETTIQALVTGKPPSSS